MCGCRVFPLIYFAVLQSADCSIRLKNSDMAPVDSAEGPFTSLILVIFNTVAFAIGAALSVATLLFLDELFRRTFNKLNDGQYYERDDATSFRAIFAGFALAGHSCIALLKWADNSAPKIGPEPVEDKGLLGALFDAFIMVVGFEIGLFVTAVLGSVLWRAGKAFL